VNASYNKAKVDYAQVNEQAGIRVGEDGIDANIHNHAQLNAAIIESSAEESKNRFKAKSISTTDIENRSEIKTESASVGAGTGGINPMQAISSTLSLLGNTNESARSTTQSAISSNIQIETETPENLTALSRDTKNANQRVEKQDLQKVQERQEMAKVIGDITNNAINIATYEEREKINKLGLEKFKLEEKYGKDNPQAQEIGKQITAIQNDIDRTYGIGSEKGMAIHAVTAALQAAAQNDTAGSLVALASPYLNQKIHEMTAGDTAKDKATNLMAHALLSAVEFQVTGKDPLTGAVAGVTGEATAEIIARAYGKPVSELTANEKENISTLSQLAGGLAAALTAKANGTTAEQGGSFIAASSGAETAKRAVENNYLYNGEVNNLVKELAKAEKEGKDTKPIFEKYAKLSEKNRQEILKSCGNNPACYIPHIQMMQSGDEAAYENFSYLRLGTYFNNLSRETQVKLSDFVESENGKTRNQLPKSVHYATLGLGAAEAAGLGGLALKTKLPKGANANEVLPIVGKTKGYENHEVRISSGAENNAKAIPLKEQLSNEVLKSRGTKLENLEVSARVEIDGKVYVDTNQRARGNRFSDPNKLTLIAQNVANKKPQKNGSPYPNANMRDAHAEIGAIQQAYEKGVTKGKNMVIHVQGRDVCTHCRQDIASAAEKAGLKSVIVHAVDDKNKLRTYTWIQGQTSIKENKNGE